MSDNLRQFQDGLFLRIFPSIMLPMFLAIVDQTIVASALISISASLGSPERVSWVIIAYLVAATIAAPISGTLGDVFGRRRMMFIALSMFLAATLLCAMAVSIEMLVMSRVLQGLGGGALATSSHALIGETVPPRERGRYQGYLASVVVTASAAGPVLGGLLTANFGWRSIFLAFIPLILIAMVLAWRLPASQPTTKVWRLDGIGLLLFVLFVSAFLLALEGVRASPLSWSVRTILLFAAAVALVAALIAYERRQAEPLIPLALLWTPAIWISNSVAFFHGAALMALVALLPIYARLIMGLSLEQSAMMLLPLTVSIGFGSFFAGRLVSRTGHTALLPSVGLAVVTLTLFLFATSIGAIGPKTLIAILILLGIGMGPTMAVVQLTVQVTVGKGALGVAAGFVQFSRSIGAAFGTALAMTALFASVSTLGEGAPALLGALITNSAVLMDDHATKIAAYGFRAAFLAITAFSAAGMVLAWALPLRRV